jgi:hypothetical protein
MISRARVHAGARKEAANQTPQRRRMSGCTEWMIYGANGYTGHLVAVEARRRDLKPVVAGRNAGQIEKLAAELGLPVRVFGLDRPLRLRSRTWRSWRIAPARSRRPVLQ